MDPAKVLAWGDAAKIARGGYYEFVKQAWHVVEQVEMVDEPHLKFIADHVEAWAKGEIDTSTLLINVPPAHSKTIFCVIMLTPWIWTWDSSSRDGYVHNDINLARDAARKARQLIESEWYRARWPHIALADDAKKIERFSNTEGGSRSCFTVRQQITGWHAGSKSGRGRIVVDDPNTPDDTDLECDHVQNFYSESLPTRYANQSKKAILVVQQRLHQRDLSQHMLDTGDPVEHVMLPMEYDPARQCRTSLGADWRTRKGEILAPKRFPAEVVEQLKKAFRSPRVAQAQLNQDPAPEDGSLFKVQHFQHRYYMPTPEQAAEHQKAAQAWDRTPGAFRPGPRPEYPPGWLPERLRIYFSWDCTFTAAETSDYAVGTTWGVGGPNYYLLDVYRQKMSFTSTLAVIKRQLKRWPNYHGLLIEQAAGGHGITDMLEVAGVKKIVPIKTGRKGKEERAHAATFPFEDGTVWLPKKAHWLDDYMRELLQFPAGKFDDQVDSTTQFITWATAEKPFDVIGFLRKFKK